MKSWPQLTTTRAAEIWRDTLWVRRQLYEDSDFFKMTDAWKEICSTGEQWTIKTVKTEQSEDYKRRAGIIYFDGRLTLTVDEKLKEKAEQGCSMSNFILAHELGHLVLNHHRRSAVGKNFQLFSGPCGMSNIPPNTEELEANYAAVFFQCGPALADPRWDSRRLANRAFSEVNYVKKAQIRVQLEIFQRELRRLNSRRQRVVL